MATLLPHTAVSRFANVGCPPSLPGWAGLHVWSARGAFLLAHPPETRASPSGLRASGSSAPPSGRPNSLWRGVRQQNPPHPPSLASTLSPAPENPLFSAAHSFFP